MLLLKPAQNQLNKFAVGRAFNKCHRAQSSSKPKGMYLDVYYLMHMYECNNAVENVGHALNIRGPQIFGDRDGH